MTTRLSFLDIFALRIVHGMISGMVFGLVWIHGGTKIVSNLTRSGHLRYFSMKSNEVLEDITGRKAGDI